MGKILLLLLSFVCLNSCSILKGYRALHTVKSAKTSQTGFCYEFPYEEKLGFVIVPVQIGQRTYRYILDTGAYGLTVTDAVMTENRLRTLQTVQLGSSNQLKSQVKVTRVEGLQVDRLAFSKVGAFNLNFEQAPSVRCLADGGLIGTSMLRNYVWQLDQARRKIIVTDQLSNVPNLEKAIKIPVTFDKRGLPFITLQLNGKPERVLLDTASDGFLSLPETVAQQYVGPRKGITIEGAQSEGANGTKAENARLMALDSVGLGSLRWPNLPALVLTSSRYAILGNDLLASYLLTLDYRNKAIYLTPIPGKKPTEGVVGFGLSVSHKAGKTVIQTVYSDSPAQRAGLRPGDEVRMLNEQPVVFQHYCDCYLTSFRFLQATDRLNVEVQRGEMRFTVDLQKAKIL